MVLVLRGDATCRLCCSLCCEMLEDCAAVLGAVNHEPKAGSSLRRSRGAFDGLLVLALQKNRAARGYTAFSVVAERTASAYQGEAKA